ncbi:translocation/assembly module TamB domain-containing protein [Rhizobium oryzicola]|uniref:Translocation/assembly module TamB domain-containing protein n=1 Tax=Rhizobium oryzicola TaxID=1232668 RepID=A0ABT8T0L9_9HYPH|nr:translocation/assembly module TamB domain-containing protein [Rhizobium oryzicola]MDO1584060.1 translocation/assembly module TamB domain-containing protein [Rhizobium oryzicola]
MLRTAAILLVLIVASALFVGFAPAGQRMAANLISSLASSPGQMVKLSALRGLLTGHLRIDRIDISDDKGVHTEAQGVAVDWSPLALLSGTFHAERIRVEGLKLHRPPEDAPQQAQTSQSQSSGFSLPVEVRIDSMELPDISISRLLTGRDFLLAAAGSVDATGDRISAKASAHRKDEPNAIADTDLVYAPQQNELKLQAVVSEPSGGLLARLLHLPGAPALALALDGQGPLSDWSGQLRGTVDGKPVISMDGRHTLAPDGRHRVEVQGGGQLAELMPPAIRPMFAGRTDINVGALFSPNGRIEIKKGELASGAIRVSAAGALDSAADNSLAGSIAGANGPIDIDWPINGKPARFAVENVNFTLTGAAASARFTTTAAFRSISAMNTRFEQVRLQAESEDLNFNQWTGSIRSRLTAARTGFTDDNLNRLIQGPIRIDAPIRLGTQAVGLDASTFESANISGTVSGAYNLSKQAVTGNLRMFLNPEGLPPEIGDLFEDRIAAEGYIDAAIGGRISLENVVVKSSILEGHGNVLLDGGKMTAHLAGRVPDLGKLRPDAKGPAGYDLTANGPVTALALKATINSAEARFRGRLLDGVSLVMDGTADFNAPRAHLKGQANVDGKPARIESNLAYANGTFSAPDLVVELGPNRVTGNMAFTSSMLPQGELAFNFPEAGLIASLAGQQAAGDLQGTVRLGGVDGKATLALNASGQTLSSRGVILKAPAVSASSANLAGMTLDGVIRANQIEIGGQVLQDSALKVTQAGPRTLFDLNSRFDNAPLLLVGALDTENGTDITLSQFSAKPRGVGLSLAAPATISVTQGQARFRQLALTAGDGRITLDGSAGSTLALSAEIRNLPASLVGLVAPNLAPTGQVNGLVATNGQSSNPSIFYDLNVANAELAETRTYGLQPLRIKARGRFEDGRLGIDAATLINPDGIAVTADGSISTRDDRKLDLKVNLLSLPASLVHRIEPRVEALGILSGMSTIGGTLAAPTAMFDLAWNNGAIADAKKHAVMNDITATSRGRLENNVLTLDAFDLTAPEATSANAKGTIRLDGEREIALNAELKGIPAALANALRLDLAAEGVIGGTLAAEGTLASPAASFDLLWSNAATRQTRDAHIGDLALRAKGRYAGQAINLEEARISGQNGLSFTGHGLVALSGDQALDMTAEFAALPAALADIARPDLEATGLAAGRLSLRGSLANPNLAYDVSLANGSSSQTRMAGLNSIDVKASGTFANGTLTLDKTEIKDPAGLSVTAQGRAVLQGQQAPAFDLNADIAALPAKLANGFIPGIDAEGVISGKVSSTGTPEAPAIRYQLMWKDAVTRQTRLAGLSGLQLEGNGSFTNATLSLDTAKVTGPSGLSISASGTAKLAGDKVLNMAADIASVPATLAQGFLPGLQTGGIITGRVTAGGTVSVPAIRYDLQWSDAEIRRQGDAGISNLNFKAAGNFENGTLTLGETRLSGPNGLNASASGKVTIGGDNGPQINLNANLAAIPANLANGFVPGLGAAGQISGKISALPEGRGVDFNLSWKDASLAQARAAGLAAFNVTASGALKGSQLDFETRLSGDAGLALTARGGLGLSGARAVDAKVEGTLPFALLATQLSAQGFVAEGNGTLNVAVGGTLAAPTFNGTASTSGARLIDVRRNLAVEGISASVSFDRDRASIQSLSGSLSTGGKVSVGGTVGLTGEFPADLTITLNDATYVDGTLFAATANGALTVTGSLLGAPALKGDIRLTKAAITVPAKLPASLAQINVKHVNPPADVKELLAALGDKGGQGTSTPLALDLTIDAPNGIFVRGRGIDAELGGRLAIRGTATEPVVSGGFQMRRGRIVILAKRLDFTTGKITFGGGLIPVLDMQAQTSSGSTTIIIKVTGVANDPDISFSSSPALPQDEVLARLIFGQSMSKLSALQIAQLADAVSQLAGGGSTSLLETLRSNLGVDDIDINTDDTGQTSVSVGRYINNRTYFQVEQGGSSGARASINLDVGRGVKLKGSAGSDGGSAGIFYEKEY